MDTDIFKEIYESRTLGRIKADEIDNFLKKFKRIGGINVRLLKKFLKCVKKNKGEEIGIYVDKDGRLAPIHSKGWVLAPVIREEIEEEHYKMDLELLTDKEKVIEKLD